MEYTIRQLVELYLRDKQLAWAQSTLTSERARLGKVTELLEKSAMDPKAVYVELSQWLKPYSLKTLFIRLSAFEAWAIDEKFLPAPNRFAKFVKAHANLFKHAYVSEYVPVTFAEARERIISKIQEPEIRAKALELLDSGMRYTESKTVQPGGHIIGKGGKPRKIFGVIAAKTYSQSYQTLRRRLKEIGLKPHTLRKLWATQLVDNGAGMADLMKLAGWSSISTAGKYLQAKNDHQLEGLVLKLQQ